MVDDGMEDEEDDKEDDTAARMDACDNAHTSAAAAHDHMLGMARHAAAAPRRQLHPRRRRRPRRLRARVSLRLRGGHGVGEGALVFLLLHHLLG